LSSKQKGPWPSNSAYRSFPRNHDSAPNTTNDPGLPLLDGHLHMKHGLQEIRGMKGIFARDS
jgi:hypothetical protein